MSGYKSIRGTCAICKQQRVTNYHYKKIHQLIPKKIFRYLSTTKVWDCSWHNVQSPDPHTMMWHYKQAHMGAATDDASITTVQLDPDYADGVVAYPSDSPPITAEAIVAAFEKRVIQIDALLAEKEAIIDSLNAQLVDSYRAHQDEIHSVKAQREQIEARTDGLVNRLFGR